jgi:hypothetical protein
MIPLPSRAEELLLMTKKTPEHLSTYTQKFELVIPQLTILLPQSSFRMVSSLRLKDRGRQVRLLLGQETFLFAKRLRWRKRAADSLPPCNVVVNPSIL